MNWQKLELMNVECQLDIMGPNGELIPQKPAITYLGALVCASGSLESELARQIGLAHAEFNKLDRVWRHQAV